jgi:hypothetical protein
VTQAKPTLEYRAAKDDRRQALERAASGFRDGALILAVVACMGGFVIGALTGIATGVFAIVFGDWGLGPWAIGGLGTAVICLILMVYGAQSLR